MRIYRAHQRVQRLLQAKSLLIIMMFCTTLLLYLKFQGASLKFEGGHDRDGHIIGTPSLRKLLASSPWEAYKSAHTEDNTLLVWKLTEQLIRLLTPFLIIEPRIPINLNASCREPPPLSSSSDNFNCVKQLKKHRKVGVLFQLGFDVDTLEIHLNELYDVVDWFFILESTFSYYESLQKPLIWELVKDQPRFEKFSSKIVHFILDDLGAASTRSKRWITRHDLKAIVPSYQLEDQQQRVRWTKFLEWNNLTNYFGPDDLLGFGDVDEIPNRRIIYHLKTCAYPAKTDPVDIGIWTPYGAIDQAFESDWPVKGNNFSWGDPTYWTLKTAIKSQGEPGLTHEWGYPSRNRGKSKSFFLGGMHMTHYGYLPFQLVKHLTNIEQDKRGLLSNKDPSNEEKNLFDNLLDKSVGLAELEGKFGEVNDAFVDRVYKIKDLTPEKKAEVEKVKYFPWFYDCNRDRYPAWERKHDTRLDD